MTNATFSLQHLDSELSFSILDASALVGRSEFCDFTVNAETLSREHARITLRANTVCVEDLHSTNGTFVNQTQIFEACELKLGDVLRFGQERFCLQQVDSQATVMFHIQKDDAGSVMLVADEEEENGTVMLQSIALPAGWDNQSSNFDSNKSQPKEREDAKLILALQAHARKKLKHSHGLLITVTQDNQPPIVKLLSSDKTQARWLIGRGAANALQLADNSISDTHACVEFINGNFRYRDLKSKNGSLMKGRKIEEQVLEPNTSLSLGPYTLQLSVL